LALGGGYLGRRFGGATAYGDLTIIRKGGYDL
jgi:hypothetical protein